MAIITSCCCWRSLRKASYACGIYTMVYYTLLATTMSITLHDELLLMNNNGTLGHNMQTSVLDPNTSSETTMIFTVLLLCISSCGILTTPLLWYGLYRDKRILLIPWIFTIIALIGTDLTHCVYIFIELVLKIHPISAILVTLNLFVATLNVYALVCVISQYQEYKEGRGRLEDDLNRLPSVHYATQPTATSYLSTRRANVTYNETKASPTHSPPDCAMTVSQETSDEPSPHIVPPVHNRGPRKSVKFPDYDDLTSPNNNGSHQLQLTNGERNERNGGSEHHLPWTIATDNGGGGGKELTVNGDGKEPDTTPLITSPVIPGLDTSQSYEQQKDGRK